MNREYIIEQDWNNMEEEIPELAKLLGGLSKSTDSKL